MTPNQCMHCGADIDHNQSTCPNCGMPVQNNQTSNRKAFLLFFIVVVIFCTIAIVLLPRD